MMKSLFGKFSKNVPLLCTIHYSLRVSGCEKKEAALQKRLEAHMGSLPGSEGQFRSDDLRVMSPARSHCATSLTFRAPLLNISQ